MLCCFYPPEESKKWFKLTSEELCKKTKKNIITASDLKCRVAFCIMRTMQYVYCEAFNGQFVLRAVALTVIMVEA